jgi:hypothetical protein
VSTGDSHTQGKTLDDEGSLGTVAGILGAHQSTSTPS